MLYSHTRRGKYYNFGSIKKQSCKAEYTKSGINIHVILDRTILTVFTVDQMLECTTVNDSGSMHWRPQSVCRSDNLGVSRVASQ